MPSQASLVWEVKAMLDISGNAVGFWFAPVTFTDKRGDVALTVSRNSDGCYLLRGRFRYYASDEPFDPHDEKKWFESTYTDEGSALKAAREIMILSAQQGCSFGYDEELVNGDHDAFIRRIKRKPYLHSNGN